MQSLHNTVNPRLSVCLSTYNRGKFIGETLDSILPQITSEVELIVVNGASPDNTDEVMRNYVLRYPFIRYFCEEVNSGVDADYDKAVGYATGEYCWLMTDDDVLCDDAIQRVLETIESKPNLVIVNAEIRSVDLLKTLDANVLKFNADKEYRENDSDAFFKEVACYISFIGAVVINRQLWLKRDRATYYGTVYIHIGVIFQHPPITMIKVISQPLIIIRNGNSMWTSRGFEISIANWPELIWSFVDFSDESKAQVIPKDPRYSFKRLVMYRAQGWYGVSEYDQFIAANVNSNVRWIYYSIARMPIALLNPIACMYCILFKKNSGVTLYDLSTSKHATWISRLLGRYI